MTSEPLLDEIRRVRRAISLEIEHNPKQIVPYYSALQKQYAERLIGTYPLATQGGKRAKQG